MLSPLKILGCESGGGSVVVVRRLPTGNVSGPFGAAIVVWGISGFLTSSSGGFRAHEMGGGEVRDLASWMSPHEMGGSNFQLC